MRAKEFIPAEKPRNFVAKNAKMGGAGQHKDKKKAEKQGDFKHKNKQYSEGWRDEADDFAEWSDYVKEKLTKAAPDQRLGLAKKLSQVEVKNFGSNIAGSFDKRTGKPTAGLGLTDTVKSALRYFSAEQDSIRRQSNQDGAPGNFSMPFGSVDIPGMENATPEELTVMKKAVMMGPEVAGAAGKLYRKNGTITSQDLKNIEKGFEGNIEWNKPMYSSPEAKASREKAMAGEGITEGSAHGYNVVKWYEKNGDQLKLTKWLRKEAGLPKDADVYFDDADLVYGDQTIVPSALVNPKLKFNDLLTALVQATGGTAKQKVDGVYRSQGVEEGTGLSPTTLSSYKKKAGLSASEADKKGDFEKGHKRFKGIIRATNKEFDNDAKKRK